MQQQQLNYREVKIDEGDRLLYWIEAEQVLYKQYSSRGLSKYLICTEDDCACKGKIVPHTFTRTNQAIHHHQNHAVRAEFLSAFEKLREKAGDVKSGSLRDLHAAALRGLSAEASGLLAWSSARFTLQRIRRKLMPECTSTESLRELLEDENSNVFASYGKIREKYFYLGAVGDDLENLVFGNLFLIEQLGPEVEAFIDGTFSVVPFNERQLLIILAELRGRPRPIFYILMHAQTTEDYKHVLGHVKNLLHSGSQVLRTVVSVMCDFEQALRKAIKEVLEVDADGCNFHFCQAVRRNARAVDEIAPLLIGGTQHQKILSMFLRLSLLPFDRMMAGFDGIVELIEQCGLTGEFEPFVDYFRHTWIDGAYPPADWCVGDLVRRTNCNLEGYNNFVKQRIRENPPPWEFLEGIRDMAFDAIAEFLRDERINAPPPPDRSAITEPMQRNLLQLNAGDIDEIGFLKNMVYWRD